MAGKSLSGRQGIHMAKKIKNIGIIGDGGWGTTLAIHLARKNYHVTVWGPFPEYAHEVEQGRYNTKFLPGIKLTEGISVTGDLEAAVQNSHLIVLATPSKFIHPVLSSLKKFDLSKKIVLSVIKGIDTVKLLRMSQIIQKELGKVPLAVLSGPTIAIEVAKGMPSTAVIASHNMKTAKTLQSIINSDTFRIYTNSDVTGVELGGSLKNVIAIACGVCDGLGFGTNAKSAILSRGLAEMARLGKALGAKNETFYGLTGLGDLVTTCVNAQSRNRSVGEALGRGKSIEEITASMSMVAEGVETVKAAHKLSRKFKIPMPITEEVYNIICRNKKPQQAVSDLMKRATKAE